MIFRRILPFFFIVLFSASASAQRVKDSLINVSLVRISYAFQMPGGDLKDRFGLNSNMGIDYLYKFKSNWVLGAKIHFLFGNDVKEDQMFTKISTHKGYVLTRDGYYTDLRIYERGFEMALQAGRIFPLIGPNKNSGFLLTGSAGLLQHKIRIETIGNTTPQLGSEYKKGYDRLSNGLAFSEFIGYQYLDNQRLINFFGGFEFTQAFTQNRRSYNYDTMSRDTRRRLDLLSGFRAGLILPLYKRLPKDFYYY